MYIYQNRALFLENISYFEIIDDKVNLNFRKVIKKDRIELPFTGNEFLSIIKNEKINYIRKIGKYFINLRKLIYIEVMDEQDQTITIRFIFDVDYFDTELKKEYWNIWKRDNNIKL